MTDTDEPIRPATSLAEQTATPARRRTVVIGCFGYAVLVLALIPFASRRLPALPQITGVYATAVLVADVCTYVLLVAQFRASGARWLLVLACAYLYSGAMALLHVLTFPGAIVPDVPLVGGDQAVGWLYTFWSLGFVALLLAAVVLAPRTGEAPAPAGGTNRRLALGTAIALASVALLFTIATGAAGALPPLTVGDRFSSFSIALNVVRGVLALAALATLWRSGRASTTVPLWISLTLVAAATGPLLTDLGGRRYTFGWYAGRASFVFASGVLLAVLLTEFAKLQGALARMLAELRRQNLALRAEIERRETAESESRGKDEFLAMLSHELRNPLGAIRTAVAVLDAGGDRDHLGDRAREVIVRQSGHLQRLIDDLLDVGRVMTGKLVLVREPVDLAEAARRATAIARVTAPAAHEIALRTTRAWISGDATRIDQLLTNLISNAATYTPPGGRIEVLVTAEKGEAVLTVADNGVGISAEVLPRIFDLFVQGPQSPERQRGGLGIGLTVAHRIVEAHGGTIRAASDGPGQGATFTVRLPGIAPPADARADGGPAPADEPSRPRRVLIAEDNDDAREMLRVALAIVGHEVHEAADGPGALRVAAAVAPDVAVLDVGLPGFDGYELARRLRATAHGASMVLIALTGYGRPADRREAMDAGFDAHLTKPVSPQQISAAIEAGARARRADR